MSNSQYIQRDEDGEVTRVITYSAGYIYKPDCNCPNCNYHVGLYRKRDIGKGMNFKCIRSIKSRDHFPNNPKTRLPCFAEWSIAPTIETYNKELEAYELLERGADLIDKALKILPHKII